MRIVLVGEFSRLHNSLKEGLLKLGHEVVIVSNGDGFKNYPSDYSNRAFWCESKLGNIPRQLIYRITKFDISKIERGLRFYFLLKKLKGFDCVQLINETPIQTVPFFELWLVKKIFKQNKNVFLLCCGIDYKVMQHLLSKKEQYSILNPYFEGKKGAKKEIEFMFSFTTKNHYKIHQFIYEHCNGIIASDLDYVNPVKNESKFLGLIPNPVNTDKTNPMENSANQKITIFLGINTSNYHTKGIVFFENALEIIKEKYSDTVEIICTKNIPYHLYMSHYERAHILLDQVYAFDQGYNALEAMARGKVVFTGAEKEFSDFYKLTEKVAINALPEVSYLVAQLSHLIEHKNELEKIGKNAKAFILKEHHYIKIAEKYLEKWTQSINKPVDN
jgi:hypothetical protein